MNVRETPKIVLLGMMTKIPVAGVVWQTVHYLVGFRRLGYDVYYVEAHSRTPDVSFRGEGHDGAANAAAFIADVMRRFDLADRWAFHALHSDGRCYGLSESQLRDLYRSAAVIINLHGGTRPLPEHASTGRLVYLATDPVQFEVRLHQNAPSFVEALEPHIAFFTFGENYGSPDCGLPVSNRFSLKPTRQPVVPDFWKPFANGGGRVFTTVGNWKQHWGEISYQGEVYHWSKHYEWAKFIDLPERTDQPFELALSSYGEDDKRLLQSKGWRVRHAPDFSSDLDAYRQYITDSRGEFTVAKDQNVRLRSGWFSDRSATYLAAGLPVITQDTGFGNILPTGEGLFAFSSMDEVLDAVDRINSDYENHHRAAAAIARDYFSYDVVLPRLLADIGIEIPGALAGTESREEPSSFPAGMVLTPVSRRPTRLADATIEAILARPLPTGDHPQAAGGHPTAPPAASIVVITYNNLPFTRVCLESVLASTGSPGYEIIVIDNGSTDGTDAYLGALAESHPHVRPVLNDTNLGFAPACNQGLALASGEVLVLLNNDVVVSRGWLTRLTRHLADRRIGLVGPVTNRIGNEAQIHTRYHTYGEFVEFAQERAAEYDGETFEIPTLTMFCLAMRRDVYEQIGSLDEQFEVGMLEDDDYSTRVHAAGYRVACADDVFVHHFGESSFGKLVPTGEHARILAANKKRFEEKWGTPWQPYNRRLDIGYAELISRVRHIVSHTLPANATVLVVSRGDDEFLKLANQTAWHFPQTREGTYAGSYPADSTEAINHLEALRVKGGDFLLFPATALWWLEHYADFGRHLEHHYELVVREEDVCLIYALSAT